MEKMQENQKSITEKITFQFIEIKIHFSDNFPIFQFSHFSLWESSGNDV
jgi:hypothetical protein